MSALRELSTLGIVVTLSNVTCLEADTGNLHRRLHPWVSDHFPSCRTGYSKPDPRAFLAAAARYGVPASGMVHIGDDWDCDIVGATGIGAATIWISHGRPVPDYGAGRGGGRGLNRMGVLVADDLAAAVPHVRSLTARRPA